MTTKKTAVFKGDRLKIAREAKNWSLQDLSLALYEKDVNLTPATLSNYENEKTSPDVNNMPTLAEALGKPLDYFFA